MELQILHWFESLHNPVLDMIMYVITSLGNAGAIWIIMALVFVTVLRKRYGKAGWSIAIGLILSLIMCNLVMKNMFARVRPFDADPTFENLFGIFNGIDDWSFPSGHTSASFAAAAALFMWHKKEGTWALILATVIAFSRLYLTVHYPTDVLASIVLGTLYGIAGWFIVKKISERRLAKSIATSQSETEETR
ncbi:MAG: phosphatase PAP2 family protein [Lachnospira sp.]|nr:phosphatase PAP2 family protein [Lachnospira sp.]